MNFILEQTPEQLSDTSPQILCQTPSGVAASVPVRLITPDAFVEIEEERADTFLCVHELFEQQVEVTPDGIALVSSGGSLTYHELNEQANQLAHYLCEHGVGPESRVGVCLKRSFQMIVTMLAILKAGGAYVPLDPTYPRERLRFMLNDAG